MKILIKDYKGEILDTLDTSLLDLMSYLLNSTKEKINPDWLWKDGYSGVLSIKLEIPEIDSGEFEQINRFLVDKGFYSSNGDFWFDNDFIYLAREGEISLSDPSIGKFSSVYAEYSISTDKNKKLSSLVISFD